MKNWRSYLGEAAATGARGTDTDERADNEEQRKKVDKSRGQTRNEGEEDTTIEDLFQT